ncbi:unnamed protein product [Soboliphyme baturini]|uniref:Uncharacterized protein n=1 Tax=Soboliphyme baturini TaxID=241478 RepID=A0A183J5N2_9BILA|nr:unnamed protein product [Soboliphyme baturini]
MDRQRVCLGLKRLRWTEKTTFKLNCYRRPIAVADPEITICDNAVLKPPAIYKSFCSVLFQTLMNRISGCSSSALFSSRGAERVGSVELGQQTPLTNLHQLLWCR